jgi:hypothetical protein
MENSTAASYGNNLSGRESVFFRPLHAIELVRLTDVDPYIEGTGPLRDRWPTQP